MSEEDYSYRGILSKFSDEEIEKELQEIMPAYPDKDSRYYVRCALSVLIERYPDDPFSKVPSAMPALKKFLIVDSKLGPLNFEQLCAPHRDRRF